VRIAIVLFNLGGPDSPEAVEPFLANLFSDPAVLPLPSLLRKPLARLIAKRRAPIARAIYAKLGGHSPILENTEAQAHALESELEERGHLAKTFIAMRAWRPLSVATARAVREWNAERIVLVPLYPQYSLTTTGSSLGDWRQAAQAASLKVPEARICCYPCDNGFVAATVSLISRALGDRKADVDYRLLLSAHGLPKHMISRGDPYQWQVEKTAYAIVEKLGIEGLDWALCYQSRVGPLEWIGPATDAEIRRAGADGKGVLLAPIAFVSEHSETLVELDIDYSEIAIHHGIPHYLRVSTVGTHPSFIAGLADMVERAIEQGEPVTCGVGRICPAERTRCGYENRYG